LPTLAKLQHRDEISAEIFKALKFVLRAVALGSFTVWLLGDLAIWLLFSDKFIAMRDLFAWQLIGDVLKVGAYVFGYLVIAKAGITVLHFNGGDSICAVNRVCLLVNNQKLTAR